MSSLRIGIVGAGANTRALHIPNFQKIPEVTVAVVANRTRASAERVAKEFGIERTVDSWREVVEDPTIDAICIGTWPYLHAEVAVAALAGGKHVLTEARISRTVSEAKGMVATLQQSQAANSRLVGQVVPAPRTLAFDATIADFLSSNELGVLREVLLTETGSQFVDSSKPLHWRQQYTFNGVNTLSLGIFYETVLRWLGEEATVVAADATIFTKERVNESGQSVPVTIPDSVSFLGRYPDGAKLVGHFSGVEWGPPRAEIRLNGERGSLRLDIAKQELWLTSAGGAEKKIEPLPEKRGVWRVESDFVASIREKRPVTLTDFATGVRYMRFTEAVWRAWGGKVE